MVRADKLSLRCLVYLYSSFLGGKRWGRHEEKVLLHIFSYVVPVWQESLLFFFPPLMTLWNFYQAGGILPTFAALRVAHIHFW